MEFILHDLGRMRYKDAWEIQKRLVEDRLLDRTSDALILVEHEHVITLGRRSEETPRTNELQGVELFHVERGGLATYHGPGQLVGYPIIKLRDRFADIKGHVRRIEDVLILCLRYFDIPAERREGHPGIWVNGKKIASIGVAVRESVTFHGFALNVDPDMKYFGLIEPCGLRPDMMTSMAMSLGRDITIENVRPVLLSKFQEVFGCRLVTVENTDRLL
jgi:lipoate-protein ligase B